MAIPAAHALHEQGFEIHWVCAEAVAPLLACYSWIHPMPINGKILLAGKLRDRVKSIAALWSLVIRTRYDFCATLYYDQRYRVLTLPVRAKQKLILSQKSRLTTLLVSRHPTEEYRRVLLQEEDGCRDLSSPPIQPDLLPSSPLPIKSVPYRIALFPGGVNHLVREQASGVASAQLLRRWPIERYVSLAQEFSLRGWEVVLLGGLEDGWVEAYFDGLAIINCLGTLSLPEVVSACNACDAVITHDTGPLHLAGLSTACLMGIFGPTDPSTRVPRRQYVVGVWGGQGFACRPCYDGRDFAPCKFNGCMHQVTSELVLSELDHLLSDRLRGISSRWRIVSPVTSLDDPFVNPT